MKLPALIMVQPTLTDSFTIVARDYLVGLQAIAASTAGAHLAANSLGGQCLECILKAVLAKGGGYTKKMLGPRGLGHNLVNSWQAASVYIKVEADPPTWVKTLNDGHGKQPYQFRYHEGIHGLAIVPAAELVRHLGALCDQVKAQIGVGI